MNLLSTISKLTEEATDIASTIAGRAESLLNDADNRASIGLAGTPLGPPEANPLGEITSGLRPTNTPQHQASVPPQTPLTSPRDAIRSAAPQPVAASVQNEDDEMMRYLNDEREPPTPATPAMPPPQPPQPVQQPPPTSTLPSRDAPAASARPPVPDPASAMASTAADDELAGALQAALTRAAEAESREAHAASLASAARAEADAALEAMVAKEEAMVAKEEAMVAKEEAMAAKEHAMRERVMEEMQSHAEEMHAQAEQGREQQAKLAEVSAGGEAVCITILGHVACPPHHTSLGHVACPPHPLPLVSRGR